MTGLAPSLLSLLAAAAPKADTWEEAPAWRAHLEARAMAGAFVLYEPAAGRWRVLDGDRARRGFLPAATFEIAAALVALESRAVADEHEVFGWDGRPRPVAAWERDHTLGSGLREGAVWLFQAVARRVGRARFRDWLAHLGYGNGDVSGGADLFWLQGGLRVSAIAQVAFLRRLEEGRLPVGPRARRLVREALVVERSGARTLHAKGATVRHSSGPAAWCVGWVEQAGRPAAYFALNAEPAAVATHGAGMAATRAILREAGVL